MNVLGFGGKLMKCGENQKQPSFGPFGAVLTALEKHRVEYIVIGGQAVVAYGASQFTRDADLWVNPTVRNLARLQQALKDLKATLRFLPPLELAYLKKGHGVHFRFEVQGRDFRIDILGRPPRVSDFSSALKDTERVEWHGLNVPVLDIPRLVATKKTDRERDYLVIQLLGEMVFEEVKKKKTLRKAAMTWLAGESRNPEHLLTIVRTWEGGQKALLESKRPAAILAARGATPAEIQEALDEEKERLKEENRTYWRPLISELRQLRRQQNH